MLLPPTPPPPEPPLRPPPPPLLLLLLLQLQLHPYLTSVLGDASLAHLKIVLLTVFSMIADGVLGCQPHLVLKPWFRTLSCTFCRFLMRQMFVRLEQPHARCDTWHTLQEFGVGSITVYTVYPLVHLMTGVRHMLKGMLHAWQPQYQIQLLWILNSTVSHPGVYSDPQEVTSHHSAFFLPLHAGGGQQQLQIET